MSATRQVLPRFTKGVITDERGVPGALLDAINMVPINGGEAWRTRSGRPALTLGSTFYQNGDVQQVWSTMGLQNPTGPILVYGNTPSATNAAFTGLNTGAGIPAMTNLLLNGAGTPVGFTGRSPIVASREIGCVFDGELLLPGPTGGRFAGSFRATGEAQYTTGNASIALNGTTVTGVGTTWTAAMVGRYITFDNSTLPNYRPFRILRVLSTTSLVVDAPSAAAYAASAYRIFELAWWSCAPGTFGFQGQTTPITGAGNVQVGCCGAHLGRVFGGNTWELDNQNYPDRLRWCASRKEFSGQWHGAEYWHSQAFVDVFPGQGWGLNGDGILAVASYQGVLYVFKGKAVYALRGFVETDGRDVGASVEVVYSSDGLIDSKCIVATPDGIVFCGYRSVYLVNSRGVTDIAERGRVRSLYRLMFVGDETGTTTNAYGSRAVRFSPGVSGFPIALSYARDRLTIHGSNTSAYGALLVFDAQSGVWFREDGPTYGSTRYVETNGWGVLAVQATYGTAVLSWLPNLTAFGTVTKDTFFQPGSGMNTYDVLGSLTTHEFPIGALNGRVRAGLVHGYIADTDGTDPTVTVRMLLGATEMTDTGPPLPWTSWEASVGLPVGEQAALATDRWSRAPLRAGSLPVDGVRMQVAQTASAANLTVYELGVEHVPVNRLR